MLRVHDDAAADRMARAHSADAVTVGGDVYFRDGRYRPDEPSGFGLLAHETTHVSAALETGGAGRASEDGRVAEEDLARARERPMSDDVSAPSGAGGSPHRSGDPGARIPLTTWSEAGSAGMRPTIVPTAGDGSASAVTADVGGRATAVHAASPAGAVPAGAVPMAAAVDRPADPAQPALDVEALRRDLLADLMSRLRTDFERGA
jgi:hypothetical protein